MHAETLIIGSGTAAATAAITAAQHGSSTILIDPSNNTGADIGYQARRQLWKSLCNLPDNNTLPGVRHDVKTDFRKIMKRIRDDAQQRQKELQEIQHENLQHLRGDAHFVAPQTVEHNHTRINAENIIIATDTKPHIPPVQGLEQTPYVTSNDFFHLRKQPRHLIILGGGNGGVELATAFAVLGSKVTVVERQPTILSWLDEDVRAVIISQLERLGIRIVNDTHATSVTHSHGTFQVKLGGSELSTVSGDALIVATGSVPSTDGLQLTNARVTVDEQGFVVVDERLRSSNKHVFAIGAVHGKMMNATTARKEAWIVLENVLLGKRVRMSYDGVPWSLLTSPPLAGFGLSERVAHEQAIEYAVLESELPVTSDGFVRLLHRDGRLLGGLVYGVCAEDLVHEIIAFHAAGVEATRLLQHAVHIDGSCSSILEHLHARNA